MTLLAWLMLALLLLLAGSALDLVLGLRRLEHLARLPPRSSNAAPLVSFVIAARDEARGIEAAARSLLAQRYPALEFVAVDDRSTDGTGPLLDRLAREDGRLRVIHVAELPSGWLGKNHALAIGAAAARGEWLLFTDADIVMQPEAVSLAVAFAEARGLDHVAALPEFRLPGALLQAFATAFASWGAAMLRPWKIRDPKSWRFGGVGAFNLVRTRAYAKAGGHTAIRLRPDDDLKLGKILKRSGARSDLVLGRGMLSVEWYPSLRATIDGLMKNSFSVVEYRVLPMLAGVPFYLVGGLAPLAALVAGTGYLRIFGALAVAIQVGVLLLGTRETGAPRRVVLLYPVISVLFAWIILRALVLNLAQGGIVWRGTFYPLAELRKNRV